MIRPRLLLNIACAPLPIPVSVVNTALLVCLAWAVIVFWLVIS